MSYRNVKFTEILVGISVVLICACLLFPIFGLGKKYIVKVNGVTVHENVSVFTYTHNDTLTVFGKDGKVYKYSGNWELVPK